MWVTNIMDQVPRRFPAGPTQLGEVHPLAEPRAPDTKEEFEEGTRSFLLLIGTPSVMRLQNQVTNFFTVKQLAEDHVEKDQAEAPSKPLS